MVRLKCKKCSAVFDEGVGGAILAPHIGPLHYIKCPACSKKSWLNIYSSVKDSITYPPHSQDSLQTLEHLLTEEKLEKKRIEESKYERV
jgi:hypothetical protein